MYKQTNKQTDCLFLTNLYKQTNKKKKHNRFKYVVIFPKKVNQHTEIWWGKNKYTLLISYH